MVKCNKIKHTDGLVLNYDNLYIFPTTEGEYDALFGDTQYTFSEAELNEMCDKINAIGCTSFMLSKEELVQMINNIEKEPIQK